MTSFPTAMTAERFHRTVVKPTVEEFLSDRFSLRRGYLAAVVAHHATEHALIERLQDTRKADLEHKKYWNEREEAAFQAVRAVATATKHGRRSKDDYVLDGWPAQPSILGRMVLGRSFLGDREGGVVVRRAGSSLQMVKLHKALPYVMREIERDFPELGAANLPADQRPGP